MRARSKTATLPFTFDAPRELAKWEAWKAAGYPPLVPTK